VRVDRILKQDYFANLAVGGQIVASRGGGTIHFPSGHIRHYIINGQGFPAVGAQYLFFLGKADFPEPEYDIVIGSLYELRSGKVRPLGLPQLERFDGTSEGAFLSQVEDAIRTKMEQGRDGFNSAHQ
jgi:hypothetical protein